MYKREQLTEEQEIARTRMPREGEFLGVVAEMLGASRFRVDCSDEKTRISRVPGRLKKRMWIKAGDLVIIEPWKVQSEERADIIWRYTRAQANWLKKKGLLTKLDYE